MDVAGLVLTVGPGCAPSGAGVNCGLDPLCPLDGVPLLAYPVRTLRRFDAVGPVVVSVPDGWTERVRAALDAYVPGHRAEVVEARDPDRCAHHCGTARIVVLSDVRHPLAPVALLERSVAAVRRGADVAVPVAEVTETVKELDPGGWVVRTVPRETLCQVQAPWAVRRELLPGLLAGRAAGMPTGGWSGPVIGARTAGSGVCGPGAEGRLATVDGHPDAFAVDTPADLELASAVLRRRGGVEPG